MFLYGVKQLNTLFFRCTPGRYQIIIPWYFINGHPTLGLCVNAQCWAKVRSVETVENLGPNTADSSKAEERTGADHLEGCCYGWPHRAEPAGPSGCAVVSPSAMLW